MTAAVTTITTNNKTKWYERRGDFYLVMPYRTALEEAEEGWERKTNKKKK